MPTIYGPKRRFSDRQAAERFSRHLTRELTAGGIPHWVELRAEAPDRWLPFVHREACAGGPRCDCGQ